MNQETPTWREFLSALPVSVAREPLEQRLATLQNAEDRPWVLNIFAGIGAWFSALFALPFFYVLKIFDSSLACGGMGMILVGVAIALSRSSSHVFFSQLSLAGLLTGNSLVLIAVDRFENYRDDSWALSIAVQMVLATVIGVFFKGSTGRFLSLVAIPCLAVGWVFSTNHIHALHSIIGLLGLSTAVLFSWKSRPEAWDVVAWAALVSLPSVILLVERDANGWLEMPPTPLWPSSISTGAALVWLVAQDAGGRAALNRPWFKWMVLATALLAAFTTPGILVAMLLVFLGRREDERLLTVIGHVFFAAFLVLFYYALNVSLYQKSLIVTGSGVLLLLLRYGLTKLEGTEANV